MGSVKVDYGCVCYGSWGSVMFGMFASGLVGFGCVRQLRSGICCWVRSVEVGYRQAVEVRLGKSSRGCVRLCEVRFGKAVVVRWNNVWNGALSFGNVRLGSGEAVEVR